MRFVFVFVTKGKFLPSDLLTWRPVDWKTGKNIFHFNSAN